MVETKALARRTRSVRTRLATAAVAVLVVSGLTVWLGIERAPREVVPVWLALLAVSAGLLAIGGAALTRLEPKRLMQAALVGALLLRVSTLFAPVSLSDDVYRYVWDGTLLAHGDDPYAHRPIEIVGSEGYLDEATFETLNSPRHHTIYPPLAQLAFGAAAVVGEAIPSTLALRILFVAMDLLAVWVLFGLLRRLDRPRWWVLIYAWNPLVYWEIGGGAHTEAILVPMLLLGACAALDDRPWRAGIFLGLAASAKLSALVVAPIFLVYLAWRTGTARALGAIALALGVFAAGFAPFASPTLIPHLRESVGLFSRTFSFNAPLYYALRDGMGYVEGWTPRVDSTLMPALAVATLLWLAIMTFVQDGSRRRFVGALAFGLLGMTLLSRVFHPWYLIPILALGVAARSPSIVLASLLLPLSYLRYDPIGHEAPWVIVTQFVPVLLALLVEGGFRVHAAPEATRAPRFPSHPHLSERSPRSLRER